MTANAGGAASIAARASATLAAVLATKPREAIARARRSQKTLSSSTTSRDLSSVSAPLGPRVDEGWELSSSIAADTTKELARRTNSGAARWSRTLLVSSARPLNGDDRSLCGGLGVFEMERAAGPFDKDIGNEQTQAKSSAGVLGPAGAVRLRQVRLADPRQYVGRKARAIIGDNQTNRRFRPARANGHRPFGESDRVLDQIAQSGQDARVVRAFGERVRAPLPRR